MSRIIPITTSRTSDVLTRSRLLTQLQLDHRRLLELQTQISTGRRLVSPSDDATSSMRAIQVQRLLERKQQSADSLNSNRTYLTATETATANVADVLVSIRGEVVGAIGTTSDAGHRTAVADQVGQAIETLISTGNQRFRGRHLFAGATTGTKPFAPDGSYVSYRGNAGDLPSFVDVGLLYLSNVSGDEAFGAISDAIRGDTDWRPIVTLDTRLEDLHGGLGITRGRFAISDGKSKSIIDVSGAETVSDVIDLIENNPPDGRVVKAGVTHSGLRIELDVAGGGNLNVQEEAGGRTAFELGILKTLGVGTGSLTGNDLNPRLTLTTPLDNVFGTRASTELKFPGRNNDLWIEAKQAGESFNDIAIHFVDSGTVAKGAERVVFNNNNPNNKMLVFDVDADSSTANDVINALRMDSSVNALFAIRLHGNDADVTNNTGAGMVGLSSAKSTAGGHGKDFDRTSGLQITNRDRTYTVDVKSTETVEDLLNVLHVSGAGVVASINAEGTGIDVRSTVSGSDFHIGENGGTTATDLGIRSFQRMTPLMELNHGRGVNVTEGTDFVIHRKDGIELAIDVSGAQTVGDVIDLINDRVDNQNPATAVVAQLNLQGNGILLVDANVAGNDTLSVSRAKTSFAAWSLGLIPEGLEQSVAAFGTPEIIVGTDRNPIETQGVFNTLLRLQQALNDNDLTEIERLVGELDHDLDRINFTRADIGTREQGLDVLSQRLEEEDIELQRILSTELDVDFVESISEFSARQAAFQASLQVVAQAVRLSLMDFL